MTLLHQIRSSFTAQIMLWVAGFVVVIYLIVIALLVRFTQQVVRDEALETTKQALGNTALLIDNVLNQAKMTAVLEGRQLVIDKAYVERVIRDVSGIVNLKQTLPNSDSYVLTKGVSCEKEGCFVFAEPICNEQFQLVVECPEEDIVGKYKTVQLILVVTGLLGLILLLYICWRIILSHLWPLRLLADSAELVAEGNLDVKVPDSRMDNEIGQLQNSFVSMQSSLVGYMDEMRQKQAILGRQNTELENAYAQAREYDELKNRFLNNMTGQMLWPIDSICELTDQVCERYPEMEQSEMVNVQTTIISRSEQVTHLLEQLLDVHSKQHNVL